MQQLWKSVFPREASLADVKAAYRLFLKRLPDRGGLEHYRSEVRNGLTIDELIFKFSNSPEYKRQKENLIAVDLGGYKVCIDEHERDFSEGILFNRKWEPHVTSWIERHFTQGQTFVDIGANVGCISLLAAKIAGPSGLVVAVEPNPTNLQRLYAGITLNGFENVVVLPYAASDKRSIFALEGGTSNTFLSQSKSIQLDSVFAQSMVLDEQLAHLSSIDFVKIDIEGHEPVAIKGFTQLIKKHDPILILEFNPRCLDFMGFDSLEHLRQIFDLYKYVVSATPFETTAPFTSPEALFEYWKEQDRVLTQRGERTPGMLHLDVIASNRELEKP